MCIFCQFKWGFEQGCFWVVLMELIRSSFGKNSANEQFYIFSSVCNNLIWARFVDMPTCFS